VLALPSEDRTYIADALERSLITDADKEALLQELQRRTEAYKRNPQSAKPVAEFMKELRSSLGV